MLHRDAIRPLDPRQLVRPVGPSEACRKIVELTLGHLHTEGLHLRFIGYNGHAAIVERSASLRNKTHITPVVIARGSRLSGRQQQARRNDAAILAAARAVFVTDPDAPIAAVADHAGVNISSLYRRFPSKEELIRQLCSEGLRSYIEIAQAAIDDEGDPWGVFANFMRRIMEADNHALTVRLAGRFTPNRTEPARCEAGVRPQRAAGGPSEGRRRTARRRRCQRPDVRVRAGLVFAGVDTTAHCPAAVPLPRAAPRRVAGSRTHAVTRTSADGKGGGGPLADAP